MRVKLIDDFQLGLNKFDFSKLIWLLKKKIFEFKTNQKLKPKVKL